MNSNFSSYVIDRLKANLGVTRDNELAKKMDLNRSTISTWRKNDSINLRKIHETFPELSMDYILGLHDDPDWQVQQGDRSDESNKLRLENERLRAQVEILQQTIGDLIRE